MADNDNLTPGQAAEILGVSSSTVRRWEEAGTLVPVRLPSGHRRYRRADVDRLHAELYGSASESSGD